MKYLVAVVFAMLSTLASAEVDLRGLTDTQRAELALQAAKMKEQAVQAPVDVAGKVTKANDVAVDAATKWGSVGKELATGLVMAAKELGVAANEFAVTPVGKITTVIIVWKLIGKEAYRFVIGMCLIFLGLPATFFTARALMTHKIEYEDRVFLGLKYKKKIDRVYTNDSGVVVPVGLGAIILSAVMFIAGMNILP